MEINKTTDINRSIREIEYVIPVFFNQNIIDEFTIKVRFRKSKWGIYTADAPNSSFVKKQIENYHFKQKIGNYQAYIFDKINIVMGTEIVDGQSLTLITSLNITDKNFGAKLRERKLQSIGLF